MNRKKAVMDIKNREIEGIRIVTTPGQDRFKLEIDLTKKVTPVAYDSPKRPTLDPRELRVGFSEKITVIPAETTTRRSLGKRILNIVNDLINGMDQPSTRTNSSSITTSKNRTPKLTKKEVEIPVKCPDCQNEFNHNYSYFTYE